jgi:NAD(P)-dependent dehydrogenase (short-subunit alcohol dehydrogenase family)
MVPRPKLNLPPLKERVILVTGATGGVGRLTAEKLACTGATVLVHGRRLAKVQQTISELRELPGSRQLVGFAADFSALDEVHRLADEIREKFPAIHGILHHASIMMGSRPGTNKVTLDGHEITLAVNVIAPFLLTSRLLDCVMRSNCGRVVLMSAIRPSTTRIAGATHCNRPDAGAKLEELKSAHEWPEDMAYATSKLCVAMMSLEFHCRFGSPPSLTFNALDPGATDLRMVKAGCSKGGSTRVITARAAFEMLTDDSWQHMSGHCYGGASQDVQDLEVREKLWQTLTEMSGAAFPPRTRRPSTDLPVQQPED